MTGLASLASVQPPRHIALTGIGTASIVAIIASVMPAWLGVVSLLWLLLTVLFWRAPVLGVAAVAFTIPLQDRMWIETLLGDSTATRYVAWALIIACGAMVARGRRVMLDRIAIMYMVVVVALVASFAAGGVRLFTWFMEISYWLLPLVVYVVCRSLGLTIRDRLHIIVGLAVGVFVASAAAWWQLFTGAGPESYEVGGLVRVYGTFGHPNTLAAYLVTSLPLIIAAAATCQRSLGQLACWTIRIGAAVGTLTLILTQSRGGWLAFAASVLFLLIVAPRWAQRLSVVGALVLALTVIGLGVATEVPGLDRFSTIAGTERNRVQVTTETWGQLERQAHWGAAWSMLEEYPLFGVGAGEFNDNFREHTTEWRFRVGRGQAHNGMLHMGAQAGLPGMAAFVLWIGAILLSLVKRLGHAQGANLILAIGATGCMIAYVVDSTFEYLGVLSLPVMLAIVVAVGLGGPQDRPQPP